MDEGRSGYDLNRPALDRRRDAVASDVILIHKISRLARDHAHQALLLRELRKRVRVEFVKHPTGDSPEGQLLENMLGAIANFERRVIAARTRRGRQDWVRQGALVGGGVPYTATASWPMPPPDAASRRRAWTPCRRSAAMWARGWRMRTSPATKR